MHKTGHMILIMLRFNDTITLVGLPEKERKEIEEIVEKMYGRDREERGTEIKVKKKQKKKTTEEIKTSPLYPNLL